MGELQDKLLRLTSLRYEMMLQLTEAMKPEEHRQGDEAPLYLVGDPVARVLKCHLLTEVALEKLLLLALEPNGEAVVSANLTYSKKLEIASRCELVPEWELIPSHIVGSLRRLNKLRNRLAHEFGATVSHEEAMGLFMGEKHPMPLDPDEADVVLIIYHYTAFIFGNMLPKYEAVDQDV
ncbi:MAG: hypothetical protein AAGN64_00745 [Bacteroidota bacterium]